MFVCLCKGITDHEIRDAASEGAVTFRQLQQRLEVSTQCGSCEEEARAILAEFRQQRVDDSMFYAAV